MNCLVARPKVFIDAFRDNPTVLEARALLKRYALTNFEITDSLKTAEIVLYLDSGYVGLADLPKMISYIRKAPSAMHFLFSESDWPFPIIPGAYCSLSKQFPWALSWSFLPKTSTDLALLAPDSEREFLFSFLGRVSTHPIREKVRMLDTVNTPCLDVVEAPKRISSYHYSRSYVQLLKRSKFVLCPRGIGASSIRIFETLSYGRVPVIISDRWQRPPGIPWEDISVVVSEADVFSIPALLDRLEGKANEMGRLAKQSFGEYFAPSVFLDRLLATLVSNYCSCSFAPAATCMRAWQALGWREIRTLAHQGRSVALDYCIPR
jgi:hypothetical protein